MYKISNFFKALTVRKFLYFFVLFFTFVYVFSIPSFGEKNGWQRYAIYISMILLTVSVTLYLFLYDRFVIPKYSIFIPLFALFGFIGTALYSKEYRSWLSLILLAISFYSFLLAFKIVKNKYVVISIISIAFFIFCLYYIFIYRNEFKDISSLISGKTRLGDYFDNPNGVSAYAVVSFATALYMTFFLKRKIRFAFILPVLVSCIVGISTGSRSFYLMIVIMSAIFLYFLFKKHKWIYLIALGSLITISVVILSMPFMQTMRDRLLVAIQTLLGIASKADTSTIQRANYIEYGFYLGTKNLLFGYGRDGFGYISGVNTYSHCNYSEVICNFGIIGFVLFYTPLIILFIKAIFDKKIDKGFIITFVLYYLIVSFSNVLYYKKIYYLVLAFMFYLAYFENKEKKVPICTKLSKIIFTCDSMNSGGAERVISSLANSFVKESNITVSIIGVSDRDKPKSFYTLDSRINYYSLCDGYDKKVNLFKRIYLLRNKLKELRPDVVISFLPHVNFYTMIACKSLKTPYIVSERNDPNRNPKNKIIRIFKYLSFMKADGCVFQSEGAKEFYYSEIRNKSIVINNPINLTFVPNEYVQNKEKTILAVGRLTPQKNYPLLLNAFKIFNEKNGNCYNLKIYGDGPLKDDLINLAKKLNIQKNVQFVGNDPNWHQKEYKDAMYVLSSDYEGMPNSLIEALALGIPCVSIDCPCGGPKQMVQDRINGFLVYTNDYLEFSKKMNEALRCDSEKIYKLNSDLKQKLEIDAISFEWISYIKNLYKTIY